MVSSKSDPVLMVVGIILALTVIGWITAASLIPSEPIQKTKYTSTGKAVGGIPCCDKENQLSFENYAAKCGGCKGQQTECRKSCNKNTPSSCQRR